MWEEKGKQNGKWKEYKSPVPLYTPPITIHNIYIYIYISDTLYATIGEA